MRRRRLTVAGVAGGALAGAVVYRRLSEARRARLDVYFDDGSFITFVEGSQEADRLLPLAQQILVVARDA